MSSEIEDQRVVLVTGFGPFEGFPINFSWETVKQLWNLNRPLNIKLITRQLPVIYDVVREQVSKLWNDIKPDLCIHVGVSGQARDICIEKKSFRKDYGRQDISGKLPGSECFSNDEACLETGLNVEKLCELTNRFCEENKFKSRCSESCDPGRYLCAFTYYLSLCEDHKRSLFVHVPPETIFNVNDMAEALNFIIIECLNQLND